MCCCRCSFLVAQSYVLPANASETGGLSGPPLFTFALSTLKTLRTLLPAEIPIIGCGGISTGSDALAFAKAGASTVQFYTALSTDGAGAVRRIKDEVVQELENNPGQGMTWTQVVQSAVRELAGTHPARYQARQARAVAPPSEETLNKEAEELKREAETLNGLLVQAGVPEPTAPTGALSSREIDEATDLKVLSDAQLLESDSNSSRVGGPGADAALPADEGQPAEAADTVESNTIPDASSVVDLDATSTGEKSLAKVV